MVFGVLGKAIGVNSTLGGILDVISVFMAFLVPLWVIAAMGAYYLATALAVASFRPVPFLLLSVAWLDMEGLIPTDHIQLVDVPRIYDGEFNWSYPLLHSALAILGSILVALAEPRKS